VGLRIIERGDVDLRAAFQHGKAFGVDRALPRTKNGTLRSSRSASLVQGMVSWLAGTASGALTGAAWAARCDGPAASENSKSSRNMVSRCSSSPMTSGCTQVSKITLAPSKPICGLCAREILDVDRGGNHRAGQAQALGDVALHLRAQHDSGAAARIASSTAR
jgi:hypothetical protein